MSKMNNNTLKTLAAAATFALVGCQTHLPGLGTSSLTGLSGDRSVVLHLSAQQDRSVQSVAIRNLLGNLDHYQVRLLIQNSTGNYVDLPTPVVMSIGVNNAGRVLLNGLSSAKYQIVVQGIDTSGNPDTDSRIVSLDLTGTSVEQAQPDLSVALTLANTPFDGSATVTLPGWATAATMSVYASGSLVAQQATTATVNTYPSLKVQHLRTDVSYSVTFEAAGSGQDYTSTWPFTYSSTAGSQEQANSFSIVGTALASTSYAIMPTALTTDTNGTMWTGGGTTIYGTGTSGATYSYSVPTNPSDVRLDKQGNLWILGNAIAVIRGWTSNPNQTPTTFSGYPSFRSLALDSAGNEWAITNNQLTELSASGTSSVVASASGGNVPGCVAVDSADNVWVARRSYPYDYLEYKTDGSIATSSLPGYPYYMQADAHGGIWIHNGSGTYRIDSASNATQSYAVRSWNYAPLTFDSSGNAWCVSGSQVYQLAPGSSTPVMYTLPGLNGSGTGYGYQTWMDPQHQIWVFGSNVLYRLANGQFTPFRLNPGQSYSWRASNTSYPNVIAAGTSGFARLAEQYYNAGWKYVTLSISL